MEHSIIHSDLINSEIKPQELLRRYFELLEEDIRHFFHPKDFVAISCPSSGEKSVKDRFTKLSMTYAVSERFANIYISPRPPAGELKEFYQKSRARKFWLEKIWPATHATRKQKVIAPQIDWMKTFIEQYQSDKFITIGEVYPNQWGYLEEIRPHNLNWDYYLIDPMFDTTLADAALLESRLLTTASSTTKFDALCLFESLDRAFDPRVGGVEMNTLTLATISCRVCRERCKEAHHAVE